MARQMTEDQVRDEARDILGLYDKKGIRAGVGQLTTFNQLGFEGVMDKPDGWYLPENHADVAVVLETKASSVALGNKQAEELMKNIAIVEMQYKKVVGILYNGENIRVFKNQIETETVNSLQRMKYYISLFAVDAIDKEHIYELTAKINNCLHADFGIKNLYHRMIFTACALVAKRYDALMVKGMDYSAFTNAIKTSISGAISEDKKQNQKLELLLEVFSEIRMNLNVNSEVKSQKDHVKELISDFIGWVTDISDSLNSDAWRGEDVMGIFFNEFNRYKGKSEAGQVFTPEHITDFIYKILDVSKDDRVLDATCGSGGFLVKAMANMIQEAGGIQTTKATEIKQKQLYGIEFDREIFALACANMLIHKDGKTNLEQMDARTDEAGQWIRWERKPVIDEDGTIVKKGVQRNIKKVLMNPPYENKYGCMDIVENVLDNVPPHTLCGFILPDKKLEKVSHKKITRILNHHKLTKIIKLPEDLFFGIGVTTSIFVFETGVPQNNEKIFSCFIEDDGLETVKNKGRHDVRGKWPEIEQYWVESIKEYRDDKFNTAQWIKPSEHLSYQMPDISFEVYEEDFRKAAMNYIMFKNGVDAKELEGKLLSSVMYSSRISSSGMDVNISFSVGDEDEKN